MKKTPIFLFIFLSVLIGLTGCAGKNQIVQNNQTEVEGFRRPDFGQPERNPDIMGLVKSVVGNEVTILKIERPSDEERAAKRSEMEASGETPKAIGINSGSVPTGGRGMGMGGGLKPEGVDNADIIEMMKQRSTGEEVVTIPVGIRMLAPDSTVTDAKEPVMREGTLEDVKADEMISIWLNQDVTDRNIAEFVLFR